MLKRYTKSEFLALDRVAPRSAGLSDVTVENTTQPVDPRGLAIVESPNSALNRLIRMSARRRT